MSKTVHIESSAQFQTLLKTSKLVVADFYADWCGPCKAIAPVYEQLSAALSRPGKVTFSKINVDNQKEVSQQYGITAMPTFMVFKNGNAVETVKGADGQKLQNIVKKLAAEADESGTGGFGEASGSGGGSRWLGTSLPRGFADVTDQVDVRGLELLNADASFGSVRSLFEANAPQALDKGKSNADTPKDWVESDTDEQLMVYVPFQSTLKVHSLHLTSLPPNDGEDVPMRPATVRIYSNSTHCLDFAEAEDIPPTHEIVLDASHWDNATGTAKLELRFVKFQKVTSLVLFIVDGDGSGDKVRLDRVRVVGETGEKRDMGKLEKVGEDS